MDVIMSRRTSSLRHLQHSRKLPSLNKRRHANRKIPQPDFRGGCLLIYVSIRFSQFTFLLKSSKAFMISPTLKPPACIVLYFACQNAFAEKQKITTFLKGIILTERRRDADCRVIIGRCLMISLLHCIIKHWENKQSWYGNLYLIAYFFCL